MKIRETRTAPGGMNAEREEERVIDCAEGAVPRGAEEVPEGTALHDWRPASERSARQRRREEAAEASAEEG